MELDLDQFVDRYYTMDPETEDLLYAEQLKNGMVVLVANPNSRGDLRENFDSYPGDLYLLFKMNRWATVTFLKIEEGAVYFIALYDDGTKRIQSSTNYSGWLVKKDMIPPIDVEWEEVNAETAAAYNKHDVKMTEALVDNDVYLDLDFKKTEEERRAAEDLRVKLMTFQTNTHDIVYPFGSGTKYQNEYLQGGRIKYVREPVELIVESERYEALQTGGYPATFEYIKKQTETLEDGTPGTFDQP